jgi:hypothetical protein
MSEAWIVLILAVAGAAAWGLRYWRKINADGVVTLDEIIEGVQEAVEHVEDIKEAVEGVKED